MCSIGEDDFGDDGGLHAMTPDINIKKQNDLIKDTTLTFCNKCQIPGAEYILPFRQPECRECFLSYVRHKFRAALGSSKVLPKDAKVLLVFDGSAESVVLLDMLHHAQTQNTFKRLHCTVTVIYIDDFQILERNKASDKDHEELLKQIEEFLKQYAYFDSFIAPLVNEKEVLNCLVNIRDEHNQQDRLKHMDQKQSIINIIDSIKSLTSRQDFLKHYRSKLISCLAKHFKHKFAFMPDISPNLATDLLIAVALGRGGSSALDVALVDNRLDNDIKLVRPLKDLNTTEIELYLKARNLKPLQSKRFGTDVGTTASLQNLTKSFVDNLQLNFSATVSTVFRTGDKIAVNQDIITQMDTLNLEEANNFQVVDKFCSFCKSILDYQDSTTLLAIEFSRLASETGCTVDECENLNAKAKENVVSPIKEPYLKKLCHACRNICMDAPNKNLLL